MQEECKNRPENQHNPTPILHPVPVSYTLSFTRNRQKIQEVWGVGVGNVGDFGKTFFRGGEATVRKQQNIGLLWVKVRMFKGKSTDVFIEELRCFCFPEWGTAATQDAQ